MGGSLRLQKEQVGRCAPRVDVFYSLTLLFHVLHEVDHRLRPQTKQALACTSFEPVSQWTCLWYIHVHNLGALITTRGAPRDLAVARLSLREQWVIINLNSVFTTVHPIELIKFMD